MQHVLRVVCNICQAKGRLQLLLGHVQVVSVPAGPTPNPPSLLPHITTPHVTIPLSLLGVLFAVPVWVLAL